MLVFPTATPWGDVIAGCAEAATSERIVFAELPAVQSLARVPELLDELDDADVAGARLLRHDGVTLESAGGGFSSLALRIRTRERDDRHDAPAGAAAGAVGRSPGVCRSS